MIRLLLVLAQNPFLASQVRVLMHRCHLPEPDVFEDLPNMSFSDATLSRDPRTLRLLRLAIQSMNNVHTLRIVLGHHNVVYGLISGFFRKDRPRKCPVRRLWLESSSLDGLEWDQLDSRGLESFRYRRAAILHEAARRERQGTMYTLTRKGIFSALTHLYTVGTTLARSVDPASTDFADAKFWDDHIYRAFPETSDVLARGPQDPYSVANLLPRQHCVDPSEPVRFIGRLLLDCTDTLTSVTFDWVLGLGLDYETFGNIFSNLPIIHAIQFRNSLFDGGGGARPSTESCLFSDPWLTALARATKIRCLAWQADSFLPCHYSSTVLPEIIGQTVLRLGHTLQSLRIDSGPLQFGELVTESSNGGLTAAARQRRLFLEHIAPEMRALEVIKVEGSIPYDERYELMRALKHSPLQKVVIIGVCYPGSGGTDFDDDDIRISVQIDQWDLRSPLPMPPFDCNTPGIDFASEHEWAEGCRLAATTNFTPCYGTLTGLKPVIDPIALHHASTVTELKLCGFRNAPILHSPHPKTPLVFRSLKRLHQLRYITTAVWMSTFYDGASRGAEICSYWLDMQGPSSTALAVANASSDTNEWAKILAERFAPSILAEKVANLMGPYLSQQALARAPGVTVRALFLMTKDEIHAELWELEVVVGTGCRVIGFRGPRGEHDAEKFREKMENRAWF